MSERRTKIYIQTTTKFKEKKEKRLEWDNNKQTKKPGQCVAHSYIRRRHVNRHRQNENANNC